MANAAMSLDEDFTLTWYFESLRTFIAKQVATFESYLQMPVYKVGAVNIEAGKVATSMGH